MVLISIRLATPRPVLVRWSFVRGAGTGVCCTSGAELVTKTRSTGGTTTEWSRCDDGTHVILPCVALTGPPLEKLSASVSHSRVFVMAPALCFFNHELIPSSLPAICCVCFHRGLQPRVARVHHYYARVPPDSCRLLLSTGSQTRRGLGTARLSSGMPSHSALTRCLSSSRYHFMTSATLDIYSWL
jgi:hypothetical protein